MFRLRLPRQVLAVSAITAATLPNREKLPIYDTPTPPIVLVETPSRLETQIGVARRSVIGVCRDAHASVQGVVSRWIGVEHAIENRIKSILSPTERLTPGILYVGIATLTGSILSRSRGLPTRVLLPPVFLLGSLRHFLPQTSANLGAYVFELERAYVPRVADGHVEADRRVRRGWDGVTTGLGRGRAWADGAADGLVRRVQDATGLKLREAFGRETDDSQSKAQRSVE